MKTVNKKGFTLIEVVLTIAIGALIFLLAFIAFRNAQVNRRDSQRRADLDKIAGEVQNYAADHNGKVPTAAGTSSDFNSYITNFKDPVLSTSSYNAITTGDGKLTYTASLTGTPAINDCNNVAMTGANQFKITLDLEKGEACRDSTN